jgi:hypothetical protein
MNGRQRISAAAGDGLEGWAGGRREPGLQRRNVVARERLGA